MMIDNLVPNLTPIDEKRSSTIRAIGHDAEIGLLFVWFKSGGVYRYDEVSAEEYQQLMNAEYLGKVFAATIRGVKPYRKLGDFTPQLVKETKAEFLPAKVVAIAPPTEQHDLEAEVERDTRKAQMLSIVDVPSHEIGQQLLLELGRRKAAVIRFFEPHKANAFKTWQQLCADERRVLQPLDDAYKKLRERVGEYAYQALKRAQQQDEANRREAEEQARARARDESETNALTLSEELELMGEHETAAAVLQNPPPAEVRYDAPKPVQPALARVEGMSGQIVWEVTIHDIAQVPRDYLVVDMDKTRTEIARRITRAQGRLAIPGVSFRETYAPRRTGGRR